MNKQTQAFAMSRANAFRQPSFWTALTILLLSTLTGCTESEPERTIIRPVRVVQVQDANALEGRGFPGRAQAMSEIDLAFRVAGPLITRPVKVGDAVEAGDMVAQIDPRDFKADLASVRGELKRAEAELVLAKVEYERGIEVQRRGTGLISDSEVDKRRAARDRTAATVASLTASVASAQDRLDDTDLVAPFNGTVVATFVENFQNVRAKQPIVRILDTSRIEMLVNMPENLISLAPLVRSVKLQFDAFPGREFAGTISEIGTEASQTTRTFPVTLIMEQPEDVKILPGMAGRGRADEIDQPEDKRQKGVAVPAGAIFTPDTETQSYVWVFKPTEGDLGVLERRPVTTGTFTRTGVMVTEGLIAGEWIVTAGVHSVHEGQAVRILKDDGA